MRTATLSIASTRGGRDVIPGYAVGPRCCAGMTAGLAPWRDDAGTAAGQPEPGDTAPGFTPNSHATRAVVRYRPRRMAPTARRTSWDKEHEPENRQSDHPARARRHHRRRPDGDSPPARGLRREQQHGCKDRLEFHPGYPAERAGLLAVHAVARRPGLPEPEAGPGRRLANPETPQTQQYFNGPAFDTAQRSCRKIQPNQGITPAQRQAALDQLLKLARCMRAHGITSFPDPTSNGGGIGLHIGDSIDPSSPQFQAAAKTCHMPGV